MANENNKNVNDNDNDESKQNQNDDSGAGNGNDAGNDNAGGQESNQNQGKMFSQEDVSRMMAREKQQGRNAMLNELGVSPDDANAIALIKAFMTAQGAANDEGDDSQRLGAELEAANRRAQMAEYKADAMKAGVKAQYVDDAVELAVARMSDDNTDFNAILNELKSKYAIWFEVDDSDDDSTGKRGTGSAIGAGKKSGNGGEVESMGKRLASMRRPNGKKSSYFSS